MEVRGEVYQRVTVRHHKLHDVLSLSMWKATKGWVACRR